MKRGGGHMFSVSRLSMLDLKGQPDKQRDGAV
jgi:hypothetical protein